MLEIAKTDSDWAFILKIDALLETASKGIIRHGSAAEDIEQGNNE